jgi:type IV secretory pathway VirD2 relaxase
VTQNRFTSLDRELKRRATGDRLHVRSPQPSRAIDDSTLIGRLEHLGQMRLAERVSPNEWVLAQGWQEALRQLGSQGDILNTTAAASGWARGYVTIGAGSTDIGGASDRASA